MNDLLIDLGDDWGHVVPLHWLESIQHIKVECNDHMSFTTQPEEGEPITITSVKPVDTSKEKIRLMSYANKLISKDDIMNTIKQLATQYGLTVEDVLTDTVYDMSDLRKQYNQLQGKPYYRMVIDYDPATDNMAVSEVMNSLFEDVPSRWLDGADVLEYDESRLVMVYETLERIIGEETLAVYDGQVTRGGMTTTIDMG